MAEFDAKNYWESRLGGDYSLNATGFIGLSKQYNNWLYKVKKKTFLRTIGQLNLDVGSMNIIDIGSGTGFYVELWKTLYARMIVGTDITEIAVEGLKKKFPNDKFYQLDIGDKIQPSEYGRYDVVSAIDVLYHIVDDVHFCKAIENIHNLLKPGGMFIFSDNFLHSKTVRGVHQVSRLLSDIEDTLQKTGFQIVKRSPQSILMNAPVDSNSHLLRLFWKIAYLVGKNELIGFVLGAIQYPIELFLTSHLKESPTTEIMVCKKI